MNLIKILSNKIEKNQPNGCFCSEDHYCKDSLLALETLSLHLGISKQTPEVKTLYACIFLNIF